MIGFSLFTRCQRERNAYSYFKHSRLTAEDKPFENLYDEKTIPHQLPFQFKNVTKFRKHITSYFV